MTDQTPPLAAASGAESPYRTSAEQHSRTLTEVGSDNSATCRECGALPPGELLYDIGGEQFHAVIVKAAWFGPDPTPSEAEPCGPVAS